MIQKIEDKFKAGIYVIQNNINSKKYVGKSKNIYKRIMQHITMLNTKNKNENRYLINAWHKYGRNSFTYYVVEYIYEEDNPNLEEKLKERELYWMKQLNSLDRNYGYNLRLDSEGKCIVNEETKQKCRDRNKIRFSNPEERLKQSIASKKARKNHPESFIHINKLLGEKRRKYRIAKCDKETGSIIKIYNTLIELKEENKDYYIQAIKGCCQGTKRSYKGFRWHYCDMQKDELVLKGMFLNYDIVDKD